MREKDLQLEIRKSAEWLDLWYYRIPDAPYRKMGHQGCFDKPYDCEICGEVNCRLELKVTDGPSIAFDAVRRSQEDNALALCQRGQRYYILVYWTRHEDLTAIPYMTWRRMYWSGERKSVTYDEVRELSIKLGTANKIGRVWNLLPLVALEG